MHAWVSCAHKEIAARAYIVSKDGSFCQWSTPKVVSIQSFSDARIIKKGVLKVKKKEKIIKLE